MVRNVHFVIRWTLVLVIIVMVAACGEQKKDEPKAEAKPKTKVTLQLSWVHEAEYVGFYEAIKQGYYAEEGLDVELLDGGFDADGNYIDPVSKVGEGQADFGLSNVQGIISSEGKAVAIASTYQRSPRVFMALAESGIKTPADFAGKKVVVRQDTLMTYQQLLDAAQVDRSQVIEVTDPALFSLEALVNGDVDVLPGFITSEAIDLELQGHQLNLIVVGDYGIEDYQNMLFASQSMIDQQPDVVLRFVRATLRGFEYAVKHPDEAAALVQTYAPSFSLEFLKQSVLRSQPLINPAGHHIGEIDPALWEQNYQLMLADATISEAVKVENTYNLSFINQIYQGS